MEKSEKEIEELFQEILEILEDQEDTIEDISARHSELINILNTTLEGALWLRSCNRLFDPNPIFLSTSRNRLVQFLRFEDTWTKFQVSLNLSDIACYHLQETVLFSTEFTDEIIDRNQKLSMVRPLTIRLVTTKLWM